MLVGMSIPISNPRQADLAAQYRPKDTTAPKTSRLDALARNYLRTSGQLADDQVKYGGQTGGLGSRTADLLVGQGGVSDNLPLRAGAFAADVLSDPAWLIPGLGAAKAVKAGKEFVTDPTVQARTNALMGRMYHGNRGAPWSVAANRSFENRPGWFNADLFGTPSKDLGKQYARANPNNKFGDASHLMPQTENLTRLRNLPKDLKVLDLMPGGKSVAEQSPELAEALGKLASGFDDVSNPARHIPLTELPNDVFKQTLEQFGFNGLRHVSGQGGMLTDGAVSKPVYAFFNPSGITSTPVAPSMSQRVGEKLYQTPSRFLDTIQEVLEKSRGTAAAGQSKLPGAVTQFLRRRGGGMEDEYGQGLGLTRTLTGGDGSVELPYNPYNLGALTRSLARRTQETPVVRGAFQ